MYNLNTEFFKTESTHSIRHVLIELPRLPSSRHIVDHVANTYLLSSTKTLYSIERCAEYY